jgi:23S rRNA pseudouridine2605 synthase
MSDRAAAKTQDQAKAERIAKVIARAGVCSRREAEKLIGEGRVAVNGAVLASPAFTVTPTDAVTIDGAPLAARERTRLWLFNKPKGLVTSNRDPEGRATIFSALPADLPRVVTVGRLDINTEGLLLLTNDGGLARILELPSTGWLRRYRVRVHGRVRQADLDRLAKGVTIDGMVYGAVEAALDREQGANCWLTMGLREGKNREVKKILEYLGLTVTRLIRISYGPFQLGDLTAGAVEEVKSRVLRDQLGRKLSEAASADFDTPARPPEPAVPSAKRQSSNKGAGKRGASKGGARKRAATKGAATDKPTAKRGTKRGHARRRRPV